VCIALIVLMGDLLQSNRVSPAMDDKSYLPPDTGECTLSSPSQQAGVRFTYPIGMEG